MAINTTPKEMPTGGGNPTAGDAINDLDFPTGQRPGKAFPTLLLAAFALRGHTLHRTDQTDRTDPTDVPVIGSSLITVISDARLHRTDPTDGPVTHWAERWGLVRHLPPLHDAALFLAQIGGRL